MKQALIDRVLKEGTVRTNRFEYTLVGDIIMKRCIDGSELPTGRVAKKLIKGMQQAIDYETAKANGEDPSKYGKVAKVIK